MRLFFICIVFLSSFSASGQDYNQARIDSLKKEILRIDANVDNIQLNLGKTQKRFKLGIITATIGYSIVIAGGQLLGREQDDLGQVLLYVGGGIGLGGTILLVDSYRYMQRAAQPLEPNNR